MNEREDDESTSERESGVARGRDQDKNPQIQIIESRSKQLRAGAQPRKTDEREDDESTSESKSDVARGRDQDKKPQL